MGVSVLRLRAEGARDAGPVINQMAMQSTMTTKDFVPSGHPIRRIKPVVDVFLAVLEPTFRQFQLYSAIGRPSISPGQWPDPVS